MLEEEEIIKVIQKYYKQNKSVDLNERQSSGPDFILGGRAIEIKGSESDFNKAIKQFFRYASSPKYTGLTVAFPINFLSDAARLFSLHLLGYSVSQSIEVILVVKENSTYYLGDFYTSSILSQLISKVSQEKEKSFQNFLKQPKNILEEALRKIVKEKNQVLYL